MINDYPADQIHNLVTNLGNILSEKLKDEMLVQVITRQRFLINKSKQASDEWKRAMEEEMYLDSEDTIHNSIDSMGSQVVQSFNSQFEMYEGLLKGSQVKGLFSMVNASNSVNPEHQVTITGVSNQSDIQNTENYTVDLFYNSDGYINKISILSL